MTPTQLGRPRLLLRSLGAIALIVLASCSGPSSEEDQLRALRESVRYRTYSEVSSRGLHTLLATYQATAPAFKDNVTLPPITHDDVCTTRMLLAYGLLLADKARLTIAETDIIDQQACGIVAQMVAANLRATAFHRQQWPGLAAAQSGDATSKMIAAGGSEEQLLVAHLALAVVNAKDQRWPEARFHTEALALMLKQPWLSDIAVAGEAFQRGDTGAGLAALKRISQHPAAPPEVRRELGAFIGKVESKAGDIDGVAFMPRLLAVVLWDVLKQHGPTALGDLMRFVDQQVSKLDAQTTESRNSLGSWWERQRARIGV